jgi:predicted nucleic acid-binding protein
LILYAETSAVLRWLFREAAGEACRAALAAATKVASSRLTLIETRRVIRRAEREGRINAVQAVDLGALFAQAASTWALLGLSPTVEQRAGESFPSEPLRTLDAIHLASALQLREAFPELAMLSMDDRIRTNAAQLGFRVESPAA